MLAPTVFRYLLSLIAFGLLHRSMAKAEETSSNRLINTDSRMQMK
jgi:hypothetical protein